jgi:ribosome-dependent ATPase
MIAVAPPQPVSSLSGAAQITGRAFPMTFFVPFGVGTFTKGLGFEVLAGTLAALAVCVPALTLISLMLLRKQER